LLPVATRQTFPCKCTFLTDSNASLWLLSSVYNETFLEIYFAKINNIFPESNRLLTKITQKMFSETFKHTYNYQEKMAQVFQPRSIIKSGAFKNTPWTNFRKVLESHFRQNRLKPRNALLIVTWIKISFWSVTKDTLKWL